MDQNEVMQIVIVCTRIMFYLSATLCMITIFVVVAFDKN